jgi:hypothetical protein
MSLLASAWMVCATIQSIELRQFCRDDLAPLSHSDPRLIRPAELMVGRGNRHRS